MRDYLHEKRKPIFQLYISNVLELFCDPKETFTVAICYLVLFLKRMRVHVLSLSHIFIEKNLLLLIFLSTQLLTLFDVLYLPIFSHLYMYAL